MAKKFNEELLKKGIIEVEDNKLFSLNEVKSSAVFSIPFKAVRELGITKDTRFRARLEIIDFKKD